MKYFKFTQIDAETGISWAINQPISGPSWPDIPGLNLNETVQLAQNSIYYLAKVDDSAVANPDNHFFELTLEEYAQELKDHIMIKLNQEKNTIYQQENEFRNSIFSTYHETATVAGIYKYNQAKEFLTDSSAPAIELRAEAQARGVTVEVMANRIIQNHENFRQKEAKIAGIRGKILDRLQSFTFNDQDPDASYNEFMTEETIGTTKRNEFENGEMVEKDVDVKIHKYSLNLPARFQYE